MVTRTIYTDPYMVVIDIGAAAPTAEWLQETTYLIDNSGHTTAMIAQTDQPTDGVSLQPVPFTPVNAQVSHVVAPTASPSLHSSHSQRNSDSSNTVIALVAVGAIFGVVVMATSLYLLRRRALRQRIRARGSPLSSGDFETGGSSTSSNSIEKFFDESKTSQGEKPILPKNDGIPSWEAFLEEAEREKGNFDKSRSPLEESSKSNRDGTGRREDTTELDERYKQLLARHRSMHPNVEFESDTWGPLPATKVPASTTKQTMQDVDDRGGRRPRSIMKRTGGAVRKGVRLMDAVQGTLGVDEREESEPVETKIAAVKKTVTFGNAEIREFGRTPLPSSAGSIVSRDNAD